MKYTPRAAAEFPNDNPDLHEGAVWVCLEPLARARPVVRARNAPPTATAADSAHDELPSSVHPTVAPIDLDLPQASADDIDSDALQAEVDGIDSDAAQAEADEVEAEPSTLRTGESLPPSVAAAEPVSTALPAHVLTPLPPGSGHASLYDRTSRAIDRIETQADALFPAPRVAGSDGDATVPDGPAFAREERELEPLVLDDEHLFDSLPAESRLMLASLASVRPATVSHVPPPPPHVYNDRPSVQARSAMTPLGSPPPHAYSEMREIHARSMLASRRSLGVPVSLNDAAPLSNSPSPALSPSPAAPTDPAPLDRVRAESVVETPTMDAETVEIEPPLDTHPECPRAAVESAPASVTLDELDQVLADLDAEFSAMADAEPSVPSPEVAAEPVTNEVDAEMSGVEVESEAPEAEVALEEAEVDAAVADADSEAAEAEVEAAVAEGEPDRVVAEAEPESALEPEPPAVEEEPETAVAETDPEPNDASTGEEPPAEAAGPDDFTIFVGVLSEIALERGAPRAANLVTELFERSRLEVALVGDAVAERLTAAGTAEVRGDQVILDATFVELAGAWGALLRGDSDDFSPCGTSTLDDWTCTWFSALLGEDDIGSLKRQLRKHGVAAFGLLQAA